MGVLEPVVEAFLEEVPSTPPGVRDEEGDEGSEDDLFAEPPESSTMRSNNRKTFKYNNELTTFNYKNILPEPELPFWARFADDFIGMGSLKTDWETQKLGKKKYCSGCEENVKKDLKKLKIVAENYKNERDAARNENEILKKELEELKSILKTKEEKEKGDVKIRISNFDQDNVDVIVKKDNFENARGTYRDTAKGGAFDSSKVCGINSFSVNLQRDKRPTNSLGDNRSKKTIAELRREFFAKEFQSEQTNFISKTCLEIKPQEEKVIVRSRLNIRVKPKQTITEMISKLTSKTNGSKIVPEIPQIKMFQRFEKTRTLWENRLENRILT